MEIESKLSKIGLKTKEISAYVAALKLQRAGAHEIAKEAHIERSTIYKILDGLTGKGLISKSAIGKRTSYIAEPPQALQHLLSEQQSIVETLLPHLLALQGSRGSRPVVRFYEHQEGIRKALSDSLNTKEKFRRDFAFIENVVDLLGTRFLQQHIEERVRRGIRVHSLRRKTKIAKPENWYLKRENSDVLREARYLPESIQFEPLVIIYDHIVAIISSRKESYALVIESPELAQAMKTLFDIAWTSAKA